MNSAILFRNLTTKEKAEFFNSLLEIYGEDRLTDLFEDINNSRYLTDGGKTALIIIGEISKA